MEEEISVFIRRMTCYNYLHVQLVPFLRNTSLHVHLKDPRVLSHFAFTRQSRVPSAHSFIHGSESKDYRINEIFLLSHLR